MHHPNDPALQPAHSNAGVPLTPQKVIDTIRLNKGIFSFVFIVGVMLTIAAALLWPRYFTAKTLILPPQQQNSTAGALAQLGALAGGLSMGPVVKSNDDMYVALFKTNRIQDTLIKRFNLKDRYEEDTVEATRKRLGTLVSVSTDKKTGLITLEASDRDPAFAANLANSHIDELRKLLTTLAVTDAQQRRVFFEGQTEKVKASLAQAEVRFRSQQEESGLVLSQALAETGVRESAAIRAQIVAKEVELRTAQQFYTGQHPNIIRLESELAALKDRLDRNESGQGSSTKVNTERGLRAVQAFRDMKVQEALLEAYIRQLEIARSDEAREGPSIQQIDVATPPERPDRPKRSMILVIGLVLTSFAALVAAAARSGFRTLM